MASTVRYYSASLTDCSDPLVVTTFRHSLSNHPTPLDRLEGSRKYLFGSMGVLGAANNSHISGVIILRGQDHKAVVEVAPDWESYQYNKLDIHGDEEDKKFFEAALAWDLSVDGKAWADGKCVSTPSLTLMIACGYIDSILLTRSSSKQRTIHDRWVWSWGTSFSAMAFYDFGYRDPMCM